MAKWCGHDWDAIAAKARSVGLPVLCSCATCPQHPLHGHETRMAIPVTCHIGSRWRPCRFMWRIADYREFGRRLGRNNVEATKEAPRAT